MEVRVKSSGQHFGETGGRGARGPRADLALSIPLDLREWASPDAILCWVETGVEELNSQARTTRRHFRDCPAAGERSWSPASYASGCRIQGPASQAVHTSPLHPKRLFCLLAFSYCVGTFSSQEIIRQCHVDPRFRSCCGETVPFLNELISFRRRQRFALEFVLTRVFENVLPGDLNAAAKGAEERLELARHIDSCDE